MIIVSQDKDEILNFDNMTLIVINDAWDDKPGQILIATDVRGNRHTLGYYKSEERAKEVLREIMMKYLEYSSIEDGLRNVKDVVVLPRVYEMPKE